LLGLVFNSEGSDGVDQFFTRDVSTSVVVEDVEAFLELEDGIFGEVLVGVFFGVESLRLRRKVTLDMLDILDKINNIN
jgi:hypothetical protein